jgi:hypothetical protein
MSTTITGVVADGMVVPSSPLPEGTRVEIQVRPTPQEMLPVASVRYTPGELRMKPREERQAVLAAAAVLAEEDYRNDKQLTGFDAFAEEEVDDDESC